MTQVGSTRRTMLVLAIMALAVVCLAIALILVRSLARAPTKDQALSDEPDRIVIDCLNDVVTFEWNGTWTRLTEEECALLNRFFATAKAVRFESLAIGTGFFAIEGPSRLRRGFGVRNSGDDYPFSLSAGDGWFWRSAIGASDPIDAWQWSLYRDAKRFQFRDDPQLKVEPPTREWFDDSRPRRPIQSE